MSWNRTWLVCAMLSLAMLSPLSAQGFGSVRQWIGRVNNERGFNFHGPSIGGDRFYGASNTHAPN